MWTSRDFLIAGIVLLILALITGSATTRTPTQTPYEYECGNPPQECVGYNTSYTTVYSESGLAVIFLITSIVCFVSYFSRKSEENKQRISAATRASHPPGPNSYTPTPPYVPSPSSIPTVAAPPPIVKPTPPSSAVAPPSTPFCSTCGKPTSYIAQYGRFYCFLCARYA
jgi:hypothetical protein